MLLTDYQKKLAKLISEGKIKDFKTYFSSDLSEIEFETYNQSHSFILKGETEWKGEGIDYLYLIKDDNKAIKLIKEFVALWDKLEKNELVKIVPRDELATRNKTIPVCTKHDVPEKRAPALHYQINVIINEYRKKQIIPYPELNTFVKNNYQTERERLNLLEENFKAKSIRNAKISQLVTVVFGILSLSATIYVQVMFSSKDRNVIIQNKDAFKDTINVKILNGPKIEKDTFKIIK